MTRKPPGSLLMSGLGSDMDLKRWMEHYRPRAKIKPSEQCLGPSWPPAPPWHEWGLTIDSQGHLSLPSPHPGHHGSAHVFPRVLLTNGFEGQGLLIAQDLGDAERSDTRSRGWALSEPEGLRGGQGWGYVCSISANNHGVR